MAQRVTDMTISKYLTVWCPLSVLPQKPRSKRWSLSYICFSHGLGRLLTSHTDTKEDVESLRIFCILSGQGNGASVKCSAAKQSRAFLRCDQDVKQHEWQSKIWLTAKAMTPACMGVTTPCRRVSVMPFGVGIIKNSPNFCYWDLPVTDEARLFTARVPWYNRLLLLLGIHIERLHWCQKITWLSTSARWKITQEFNDSWTETIVALLLQVA